MSTEGEDVEALNDLVADPAFREFIRVAERIPPNILRIAGIQKNEVYITKIVAWLLTPNESHALGDAPLRSMLILAATGRQDAWPMQAIDAYTADLSMAQVQSEGRFPPLSKHKDEQERQVDILVELPAAQAVVVIENKIWETQNGEKQGDYVDRARNRFAGHRVLPILLSPYGRSPADKQYAPVSYCDWIAEIRQLAREEGHTGPVVEQFLWSMEDLMGTGHQQSKLQELRLKLWASHRSAMERLVEWAPTPQNFLRDVLEQACATGVVAKARESGGFVVTEERSWWFCVEPTGLSMRRKPGLYYCVQVGKTVVTVGMARDPKTSAQATELVESWEAWTGEHKSKFDQKNGTKQDDYWLVHLKRRELPKAERVMADLAVPPEQWNDAVREVVEGLGLLLETYLPTEVALEAFGCHA